MDDQPPGPVHKPGDSRGPAPASLGSSVVPLGEVLANLAEHILITGNSLIFNDSGAPPGCSAAAWTTGASSWRSRIPRRVADRGALRGGGDRWRAPAGSRAVHPHDQHRHPPTSCRRLAAEAMVQQGGAPPDLSTMVAVAATTATDDVGCARWSRLAQEAVLLRAGIWRRVTLPCLRQAGEALQKVVDYCRCRFCCRPEVAGGRRSG